MTLPETIVFPLHSERILTGDPKDLDKYLRELVFSLQSMYEDLAQGINGDVRADFSEPNRKWTPLLKDTANSGTTFTYDHQVGWVKRIGTLVDVWFDIKWTVNSGDITGNMFIELPYKVAVTNQKPFVGLLQPSIFAYTGGTECVINAISDTYRLEVWNCGSGFTTANQASVAAGQLIGHIRYIGQQDER
tara:strand:- start:3489 stop:4058 length:570 start_codon:yes stop_codon:yes gene_type:complete